MSSSLGDILTELYSLSPELKHQEDAIIRIIEKMQKNKPEIELNEVFREELKSKIVREFALQKVNHQKYSETMNTSLRSVGRFEEWFSKTWFLGFGSAVGVGLAGFLIAIPMLGLFRPNTITSPSVAVGGFGSQEAYTDTPRAMKMTSQDTINGGGSGGEIPPYYEYLYTGSLDFIPNDLKSYKQLYPSEDAMIGGYFVIEPYGAPLDQQFFDPRHLNAITAKNLVEGEIRNLISKGGDEANIPQEGQKRIQIPLTDPKVAYVRQSLYSQDGINIGQMYIPAIHFQSLSDGTPRDIVIPIVKIPN